jgi:hypothetical protein
VIDLEAADKSITFATHESAAKALARGSRFRDEENESELTLAWSGASAGGKAEVEKVAAGEEGAGERKEDEEEDDDDERAGRNWKR